MQQQVTRSILLGALAIGGAGIGSVLVTGAASAATAPRAPQVAAALSPVQPAGANTPLPAAPATIAALVSPSGTDGANCGANSYSGTIYRDVQSAVDAVTSGGTVYVCAGTYNLTDAPYQAQGTNTVAVNKSVVIDGVQWSNPAPSTTLDPASQSVLAGGFGIEVSHADVRLAGLSFAEDNGGACGPLIPNPCYYSVTTNGVNNLAISNDAFVGEAADVMAIHIGQPNRTENTGVAVTDNAFSAPSGGEQQLVLSGTNGAVVAGNRVHASDAVAAFYFGAFNKNLTVTGNSLTGATTGDGIYLADWFLPGSPNDTIRANTIRGYRDAIVLDNLDTAYRLDQRLPYQPMNDGTISLSACRTKVPTNLPPATDAFTLRANTIADAANDGIVLCGAIDGTVRANSAVASAHLDEADASAGAVPPATSAADGFSADTLNSWRDNAGESASPTALLNS